MRVSLLHRWGPSGPRHRLGVLVISTLALALVIGVAVVGTGHTGSDGTAVASSHPPLSTTPTTTESAPASVPPASVPAHPTSSTLSTSPAPAIRRTTTPSQRATAPGGGTGGSPNSTGGAVSYASTAPDPLTADIPAVPGLSMPCRSPDLNACVQATVQAIDGARDQEGIGPIVLPTDFDQLTVSEQLFVIIDCERVDRDLAPIAGIRDGLDQVALIGAEDGGDPSLPSGGLSGLDVLAWGGNWASTQGAVEAVYGWMYDDGLGSDNIGCTAADQSGCWDHRDDLLGFQNDVDRFGGSLSFGGADVPTGGGNVSVTTITTWSPDNPGDYYYTWADAVAEGAS